MRIGVTGSRQGLSPDQAKILNVLLHRFAFDEGDHPLDELHYGDFVGADEEIAAAAIEMGFGKVLHCHPATKDPTWDAQWRANTAAKHPGEGIVVYEAKPPLDCNDDIVASCDVLWCFPKDMSMTGGTWYTINKGLERAAVRPPFAVRIVGPVVRQLHALPEEVSL